MMAPSRHASTHIQIVAEDSPAVYEDETPQEGFSVLGRMP